MPKDKRAYDANDNDADGLYRVGVGGKLGSIWWRSGSKCEGGISHRVLNLPQTVTSFCCFSGTLHFVRSSWKKRTEALEPSAKWCKNEAR